MSLRFIIGRAGSGKTYTCLKEIQSRLLSEPDGNPLLFIVPEQATFQTEASLAAEPGLHGTIRAQVLSFRRLAWRVIQETGGGAKRYIGDIGKHMVLRQILEQNRDRLQAFQKSAGQAGFIDCLAEAIGEFKKFCVSPARLKETGVIIASSEDPLLGKKIADLSLLYQEFDTFLGDKYTDPDDYLTKLAENLAASKTAAGAEVWMDGFAGFTPQEFGVVEKLLLSTTQLNIALCMDPKIMDMPPREEDMFFGVWDTFTKLTKLAQINGIEILPSLILDGKVMPRFLDAPLLGHIENNWDSASPKQWEGDCGDIVLASAANIRAEVEWAARKIIELCRDHGYRWRDISVVVRDLSLYRDFISAVFRDFAIPCFIDVKRDVLHHPLIELIRSALEAVRENWAYDPVFRYLKTDLVPGEREDIDLLENYVLAHGIRGSRWYDGRPWTYLRKYTLEEDSGPSPWEEKELESINLIREMVCKDLREFSRAVGNAQNVKEMCTAVCRLMDNLEAENRLKDWHREAVSEGKLELALEYTQIWDAVLGLLDELVETMGELAITPDDFAKVLDAGFDAIRLGLIPPSLDQVFAAALDRSRNPNVKACFVLGVNDGVMPARIADDGVFSSREREMMEVQGCGVAPGSRRRLLDEQFLIYIALTRAKEKMWVSFALADEEGRALKPSLMIRRLKELVPGLEELSCPAEPPGEVRRDMEFITGLNHGLSYLGIQLRNANKGIEISSLWWDVFNCLVLRPGTKEKVREIVRGLSYSNQENNLSRDLAGHLFGGKLRTSISRLEKFRACPFSHLASFGLRLKERDEFRLGAPDLGQFFHAALQAVTEKLASQGPDWGQLTRKDCALLAEEAVRALVPKLQNEILLSTARYRYLVRKLTATVTTSLMVLAEHAKRGDFRPIRWEVSFGPEGPLSSLKIDLGNGREMELTGRIDRIDGASRDGRYFIRVVDYKSGRAYWDLTDVFHGLRIQLLAYLLISLENSEMLFGQEAEPAGMLYFEVHNPMVKKDAPLDDEEAQKEFLKLFKMSGAVTADPEIVRMMDREIDGYSPVIPVAYSEKKGFYANAPGVSPRQFQILRDYLRKMLRDTAGQIMEGLASISPYKKGDFTSCGQCSFKPVCHFDLALGGNKYRPVVKEKEAELWQKFRQALKEDNANE